MKTFFKGGIPVPLALWAALCLTANGFSQSVATTTYPVIYYAGNPTILVDPGITITSSTAITDVRVRITQNFNPGDALNYTGSLPAGVSGSYSATDGELVFTGTATAAEWQSLLRTVTYYTSSAVTDNRNVTFSIGNLIAGSNGHFYEYVPFGSAAGILTWKQAKDAAAAKSYYGKQGYLATITSQEENDIIYQKLSASGWIGSSDDYQQINTASGSVVYADQTASEGNWYWVTGPEAGIQFSYSAWAGATPTPVNNMYVNWSANEPNNNWNIAQNGETGEQYGEIYSGASAWGQPGKWNDFYNLNADMDFVQGYIVEYAGMPGDAAVTPAANRTIIFSSVLAANSIQLNAVKINEGVRLNWQAISAGSADSCIVLHSTDRIHFSAKCSMAVGNNNNYSWVDYHADNNANYYQIKITNKDGSYSFSPIVKLVVFNANDKLRCFPNPVQKGEAITLNIKSTTTQTACISIFSISGVRLYHIITNLQTGIQTATINIDLPAGIYLISVSDKKGNGFGAMQQIIVR